jgi:Sporulation inhibitor A
MSVATNEVLIDAYQQAIELNLDPEFIEILLCEIQRRGLRPPVVHSRTA